MTNEEKAILKLATAPYKYAAAREADATEQFGLTPTQYWQAVNRIIDNPAARAYDPHGTALLIRQRTSRGRTAIRRRLF
ncbi:DUF3263 domain-containing protein [Paenarthrobacter nitroguajacolicus]|uniref:DUF3263 domain-containing protein n=1 Tax=Paenarthrobacter nitroguajacolicus TaxID=211146 RepID=UPI00142EDAEE|nr:DUF3263 domain-containing protein [Paenarthrobacter nitroguajacolicus]